MTAAEILASLQRRGVVVVPWADGTLRYRPRDALSNAERADMASNRDALLGLLDADPVGWRTAVMAAQMPRSGAIPLLLARPSTRLAPGACCSCGDPLGADDRYRCGPCVAAAVAVVDKLRAVAT